MGVVCVLFFSGVFYLYTVDTKTRASVKEVESKITRPDFEHDTNQAFINDLKQCVKYIYFNNRDLVMVNIELLIAQAALESAWGTSRFAREGNNLFGIRTYDLREPHMLPWKDKPQKWGVKVFKHECDSVENYINILNNGSAFENYRQLRKKGIDDPYVLVESLDAYATDINYFPKVKSIIRKIRNEYK